MNLNQLEKERYRAQRHLIAVYQSYKPNKLDIYNAERTYKSIERKIKLKIRKIRESPLEQY